MKKLFIKFGVVLVFAGMVTESFAGNKDRTGQAGASELLINPWGQSTGLFGINSAKVSGVEAMKVNIAGLAYTKNTEIGLARTEMLSGSGVSVNNFALAQKVGNFGVLGFNLMSMGFEDITITTWDMPTGGVGSYKPQFLNATLGFAKEFNENIYAGISGTFVSEQIADIKANGACFDAGVHYVTGKRDNFHFGVTLRNIGTNMRFSGSGFAVEAELPEGTNSSDQMSMRTPTEKFEMPTYLNFSVAYDLYLDENKLQNETDLPKHRASLMASFTSNSFLNDYFGFGVEYSFREMFMVRGAYRHEKDIRNMETPSTFYTGFSAGATIQSPIGKNGPTLALDYSFRPTQRPANGVHVVALRFMTRERAKDTETAE
ncbi:MAG TPA: PorV/PorQ family protein [Flavipsychrobacter sp.]|nr:PorV/PorQ family protein [Flavipsychrobacter sp.]